MLPTFIVRTLRDGNTLAKKVVVPTIVNLRPIDLDLTVTFIAHDTEAEIDP
jgi:hypothetical protein